MKNKNFLWLFYLQESFVWIDDIRVLYRNSIKFFVNDCNSIFICRLLIENRKPIRDDTPFVIIKDEFSTKYPLVLLSKNIQINEHKYILNVH